MPEAVSGRSVLLVDLRDADAVPEHASDGDAQLRGLADLVTTTGHRVSIGALTAARVAQPDAVLVLARTGDPTARVEALLENADRPPVAVILTLDEPAAGASADDDIARAEEALREQGAEAVLVHDELVRAHSVRRLLDRLLEERDERQERDAARQRLLARNDELRDLARRMGHDLRTPLAAIGGFARTLRDRIEDDLDEQSLRMLDAIVRGVIRLDDLVDDLLEQADALARVPDRELVSVREIVEDVLVALRDDLEDRDARVTIGALPSVWGSAPVLQHAMHHLIANAVVHSHPERALVVHVDGVDRGSDLLIRVNDNGPGIPEAWRPRLLNMHAEDADENAFDRAAPSAGRGMVAALTAAVMHGGTVRLQTSPLGGLQVTMRLPQRSRGLHAV